MKDELEPLSSRTRSFALRVIRMYLAMPRHRVAQHLAYQALRAGTSVGAQYREACRSRSDAELVSKLESVLQELDETQYWLELLVDSEVVRAGRLSGLQQEADELVAIFVAIVKKVKGRQRRRR